MRSLSTRSKLFALVIGLGMTLGSVNSASGQVRIRGGYDLANLFGDGVAETDTRNELGLGAAFTLLSVGPVSISPEVYYRQKGARNVQEFNQQIIQEGTAELGLDYIEVPLLLRVNLPTIGSSIVPYLNGGPAFGWRINCTVAFAAESGMAEQQCADLSSENLEETLRDYEVGAVFGGGFDLAIFGGVGAINLDARVTQGLSRINEIGTNGAAAAEVRNRVFSFMLGYSFGIPGGMGIP